MDFQFISMYLGKFVTSQTASFSHADIPIINILPILIFFPL